VARHISLQIIDAALRLKSFTVSDVCYATGLQPESVYPQLARLKQAHYLTARSLRKAAGQPAHRPLSTYSLTADPAKQQELADRLTPVRRALMPRDEALPDLQHAEAALTLLESLIPVIQPTNAGFTEEGTVAALTAQLQDIYSQLENATYRIPEDLRDPAHANHPLAVAWKRWRRCNELIADLQRDLDLRAGQKKVRERVKSQLESAMASNPEISFSELTTYLERAAETEEEPVKATLNSMLADLDQARNPEVPAALETASLISSAALKYCTDPELSLACNTKLIAGNPDDFRLRYNGANLQLLAGSASQAFDDWRHWGKKLVFGASRPERNRAWVLKTDHRAFTQQSYRRLTLNLRTAGALSAISRRPIPFFDTGPYVPEPTLFDPLRTAEVVRVPAELEPSRYYVYGSFVRALKYPGVVPVQLSTGLLAMGIPERVAWKAVHDLGDDDILLVVESRGGKRPDNFLMMMQDWLVDSAVNRQTEGG
jgi:hypothetical protein